MHTLKINGFQPYAIQQGPQQWEQLKNQVADAYLNTLRRLAPNLTDDKILGRYIVSPVDLERLNRHFWHGSAHAGYDGPGQSGDMRPVPGWSDYRMPIAGLYQTGACTRPGGSVNGTPGRNAAAAMLKDFGTSIEEVVSRNA
jgi:phytoene dehydrogenase-like protein